MKMIIMIVIISFNLKKNYNIFETNILQCLSFKINSLQYKIIRILI